MKHIALVLLLTGSALALAGCVVEAGRPGWSPGWCYYHPYRC